MNGKSKYSTPSKAIPLNHAEKNSIFIGNPGAGKSTILNTIFENPTFASGLSLGEGLTHTHKVERRPDGSFFTDTPGLADLARLQDACKEIEAAMSKSKNVQLIFVLTLESGYFRPADIAVMSTILQAVSGPECGIGVSNNYGIILNKLSEKVYEHLRKRGEVTTLLGRYQNRFDSTQHILYLREEESAKDADNAKLNCKDGIMEFLARVPFIDLNGGKVQINKKSFRRELEWINEEEHKQAQSSSQARKGHSNTNQEMRNRDEQGASRSKIEGDPQVQTPNKLGSSAPSNVAVGAPNQHGTQRNGRNDRRASSNPSANGDNSHSRQEMHLPEDKHGIFRPNSRPITGSSGPHNQCLMPREEAAENITNGTGKKRDSSRHKKSTYPIHYPQNKRNE